MKNKIKILTRLSAAHIIVFYYLVAVLVSTTLLLLPITQQQNAELALTDAVFISISAVTVTGLSTIDASPLLSVPGRFFCNYPPAWWNWYHGFLDHYYGLYPGKK